MLGNQFRGEPADGVLIAPCSADFIFKLSHGACDDLLSTLCAARPASVPLLIVPAMNVEMWQNPATQRNVAQLQADDVERREVSLHRMAGTRDQAHRPRQQ